MRSLYDCAATGFALGVLLALRAVPAAASCNQIPGTVSTFRGAVGNIDRPFAEPGDTVEIRQSQLCDDSVQFDSGAAGCAADDLLVTLVFKPPGARRDVVVLAADCDQVDLSACRASPSVQAATCVPVTTACGGPGDVQLRGPRALRIRIPDTDALLDGPNDDRTLSGPVAIAVTSAVGVPPCRLVENSCTQLAVEPLTIQVPPLLACIDDLFAVNGSCDLTPHAEFSGFTALPPANDYQALCVDPSPPCSGTADELRLTVDRAGNLLVPVVWTGVLVGEGVPVARLLRAVMAVDAFPGSSAPLRVPAQPFLESFAPQGGKLPPIFEPQVGRREQLTLFGTADAARTVLRVHRRGAYKQCTGGDDDGLPCFGTGGECSGGICGTAACVGGENDGAVCATDAQCPGGECGRGLFDVRSRLYLASGLFVVPRNGPGLCQAGASADGPCATDAQCPGSVCVAYRFEARDPVPLDGLRASGSLFAFAVPEPVAGRDLNGDGDTTDDVVLILDRRTGEVRPSGTTTAGSGRAVARIRQPPFSFPAVAATDNVVALLESEPLEGARDANRDGDVADTILRGFAVVGGNPADVTGARSLALDAAPVIDGAPIVSGDGLLTFRLPEWAGAHQTITAASTASNGMLGDGPAGHPSISADGRFVAFDSTATNLVAGDTNAVSDVFVHDVATGATSSASTSIAGPGNGPSRLPSLSADGRSVAFESRATNLTTDANGIVDDVFLADLSNPTGTPALASIGFTGMQGDLWSFRPALSANGQAVAFESLATTLVAGGEVGKRHIYLRDATGGRTFRVSTDSDGRPVNPFDARSKPANKSSFAPAVSGDGSVVAFETAAGNLAPRHGSEQTVQVHELATGNIELMSIADDGGAPSGSSFAPSISTDGTLVAFASSARNLVAGDTNGLLDVFVRDRIGQRTERISVASDGRQALDGTGGADPSISPDGRYVAFASAAGNLVPDDTNGQWDILLRDRLIGTTSRVSVTADGVQGNGYSVRPAVSTDGRYVAFETAASTLVPGDVNGAPDVVVRGPDRRDVVADYSGDGDLSDTLLAVIDTVTGPPGVLRMLCPSGQAAVAGRTLAFLRPEAGGDARDCPPGDDLNGDGDEVDDVVHLWREATGVTNAHCAATTVAVSRTCVAALVSERAQGSDLNGDSDIEDQVVRVLRLSDPPPASCGSWLTPAAEGNGLAADTIAVTGSTVAFLTPEAAQGTDLNGDGDQGDRVLHVYDAVTAALVNTGQAAEDFVAGENAVALRTNEAAQRKDLNGDGDSSDDVLQVYAPAASCVLNTAQAVTPCRLEACDPRLPYRVKRDTVTFLTFEGAQGPPVGSDPQVGSDLNGDGDSDDLVLQTFNLRAAEAACGGGAAVGRGRARQAEPPAAASQLVGAVSTGVCTNTGHACAFDVDCAGACANQACVNGGAACAADGDCAGLCFVPPGRCVKDTGARCCLPAADADADDAGTAEGEDADPCADDGLGCAPGQFCQLAEGTTAGTCIEDLMLACASDLECHVQEPAARCIARAQTIQRLVAPFRADETHAQVFASAGRCLEDAGVACEETGVRCARRAFCDASGHCMRDRGVCKLDTDCAAGSVCRKELLTSAANDSDGDEIADPLDNCPHLANVTQADGDGDDIGDACERAASCTAAAPENPCIPGGGAANLDCIFEWLIEPVPPRQPNGQPRNTLVCSEGDPRCDADALPGDGACTFRVGGCIGNDDPRLPNCSFNSAVFFRVLEPDPLAPTDAVDTANSGVLEEIGRRFGLWIFRDNVLLEQGTVSVRSNHCSALYPVEVPLGTTAGGAPRSDTRTLRVRVDNSVHIDNDTLQLECRPSTCGDGVQQNAEDCDDGNRVNGDGCDQACRDE